MNYQLNYTLEHEAPSVRRIEDRFGKPDAADIPFDELNRDFIEYQEWLAEGNTPLPAQQPFG